jgi:RNA polymerase sigma-70 factor, ECF subfamily
MGALRAHLSVVDHDSPVDDDRSDALANSPDGGTAPARVSGVDDDFVALYKTHYPRLVRALELSGSSRPTAEDVAQEAFARTLWHWKRVKRGTNPAGYVYRVAFRLFRRDRRQDLPLVGEPVSPDIAAEVTLSLEIERALQAMSPAQRKCAVLCLAVGLSTKEAARALGIAESTVRKQIERARGDLRQVLGELP